MVKVYGEGAWSPACSLARASFALLLARQLHFFSPAHSSPAHSSPALPLSRTRRYPSPSFRLRPRLPAISANRVVCGSHIFIYDAMAILFGRGADTILRPTHVIRAPSSPTSTQNGASGTMGRFERVSWSPSRTLGGRCVLAACTSQHQVFIYAPPLLVTAPSWEVLAVLSDLPLPSGPLPLGGAAATDGGGVVPLSYWSPCSASISPPLGSEGGGGGAHPYAAVVGAYTVCVHWLRALDA